MLKLVPKDIIELSKRLSKSYTLRYIKKKHLLNEFIQNGENVGRHYYIDSYIYNITSAFNWAQTTQDHEFWKGHYLASCKEINKEFEKYDFFKNVYYGTTHSGIKLNKTEFHYHPYLFVNGNEV